MLKKITPRSPSTEGIKRITTEHIDSIRGTQKLNRAYHKHQAIGADIGEILHDTRHTALYIKLAMQFDEHRLRALAKSIADNKNVRNKGAYFMRVLYGDDAAKHYHG